MHDSQVKEEEDMASLIENGVDTFSTDYLRTNIRHSLEKGRTSLTWSKLSFVKGLIDNVTDEELNIMQHNLSDSALFFAPTTTDPRGRRTSLQHMGSFRRLQQLELRRRCIIQAQLWQRARLSTSSQKSSKSSKPSLIATVREIVKNAPLSLSPEDKDEFAQSEEKGSNISSKHLLTKRASSNVYDGIGFEIAEEELFAMFAKHYNPWEDKFVVGFDFHIIGELADHQDAKPHVLLPPLKCIVSNLGYLSRNVEKVSGSNTCF
jgi:hypothetical protein